MSPSDPVSQRMRAAILDHKVSRISALASSIRDERAVLAAGAEDEMVEIVETPLEAPEEGAPGVVADKVDQRAMRYTAKTQPRDARGRFRQVLARIKQDLGVSGNANVMDKVAEAENLDFAGNYRGAVDAATELIEIIDRLDSGALNPTSLENVRTSSAELGKVIANLPFAFGDQTAKIRYSDVPPALQTLMEDMIKRVEQKIGKEDADKATEALKKFKSGSTVLSQSDISSQMSTLLRLLT